MILADVSTDGHWCFVVFWVVPRSSSIKVRWASLKNRLMSMCPSSYSIPFYPDMSQPGPSQFYLLKLLSPDRKGLLHGNYYIYDTTIYLFISCLIKRFNF